MCYRGRSVKRDVFREAVSYTPTPVSVAGFWYLTRSTVSSVGLMVISYIIVLSEFRQQGSPASSGSSSGSANNCSCVTTN
ncbi:Gustatory receptor for sugar taste 64b [Frankliniella fusca]|uniref:Gustatory receptor for sugar taste 64b n=1 Tax=Frankliniella fusca TaxID=407009 RepID=A0AAE1LBW6_9NEOP|nr:Gustatory receptor for sugar taste 64b [Frankliniella fusca]